MPENINKPPAQEALDGELRECVRRLEEISSQLYPEGDRLMARFVAKLKSDGISGARVFVVNEYDKFRSYGEEALYLIIDNIFGGAGSPWKSLEQKRRQ